MRAKNKPIPAIVKDLFYVCEEGIVRNKVRRSRTAKKDEPAGAKHSLGKYRTIMFKHEGKRLELLAHRIAWYLHYNEQPPVLIDHKDGDGFNNKKENLRECTYQENMYNMSKTTSSTGVKGVSIRNGRYIVRLRVNGKTKTFGTYDTLEEAEQVVIEKRELYHKDFANHGETIK